MTPPFRLAATHPAGLSNRLKNIMGALRIDPGAVLVWPTDELGGHWHPVTLPRFTDLFSEPSVEVAEPPHLAVPWTTWRWPVLPGDGVESLDFLYAETPARPLAEQLAIVAGFRPVAEITDRMVLLTEGLPPLDTLTGIHARTLADVYPRPLDRPIQYILGNRPCWVASDSPELLRAVAGQDGVYSQPPADGFEVWTDFRRALVDLLILSRCRRLAGKQLSTFTELAWFFGGGRQAVEFWC